MRFIRTLFIIVFSTISLSAFAKPPKYVSNPYADSTRVFAAHCNGTNEAECKKSKEAFRLISEGVSAYRLNDVDAYIKKFNQSADYFKELGETTDYIIIKNSLGEMLTTIHRFEEAVMVAYDIRRVAESTNDPIGMAQFHIRIGSLYYEKNQNKAAQKEYNLAYTIYKQVPESEKEFLTNEMARLNHNYGMCCFDLKDYARAEVLFISALAYFQKENEIKNIIVGQNTLGRAQLELGKLQEAQKNMEAAYDYSIKSGFGIRADLLNNLAELYNRTNKHQKALEYAQKSYEICVQEHDDNNIEYALLLMFDSYGYLGKYKEAYAIQHEINEIRERFNTKVTDTNLADVDNIYQLESKQLENQILENNLAANQRAKWLYLSILLVVALASMSLGYFYYINYKQRKKLEALDNLNKQIFSILSHDLRAPINGLNASLRILEAKQDTQKFSEEHLPLITDKLNRVSGFLETVLKWSQSQLDKEIVDIKVYNLDTIVEEAFHVAEINAANKNINLSYEVADDVAVMADKQLTLGILRNLLDNAIKFTPINGEIKLKVEELNNQAYISIQDSGIGMDKETRLKLLSGLSTSQSGTEGEKGMGLGWQLITRYIQQQKGVLDIISAPNQGTRVTFSLPMV